MNRLYDYLALTYSKKEIKSLLTHGSVLVDGKVVTKFDYILKDGQRVTINKYNKSSSIDIIYEDNDIIVVNKKAGILTVNTDTNKNVTLYNLVSEYVKKKSKSNKIFVIHRLDRDTSGVVMFAKSERVKKMYQDSWDDLVIERQYIAIVNGITKDSGTIKSYLTEDKNHYVHSSANGKLAITHYKKLKSSHKYTWLYINIDTGRKNQIRVHLKELGFPIVGDNKYGHKDSNFKRLCLHANKLVIINPINKKEMTFIASIPAEFKL